MLEQGWMGFSRGLCTARVGCHGVDHAVVGGGDGAHHMELDGAGHHESVVVIRVLANLQPCRDGA